MDSLRKPVPVKFRPRFQLRAGFTLIELLVATSVLLLMMAVLLQLTGGGGQLWKSSSGKISAFQSARSAFATITRTLARSTLNTYNDYVDANGYYRVSGNTTFTPSNFLRTSELHFLSGPAAEVVPGADGAKYPGQAILYQAPLGATDDSALNHLNRSLNAVGFYIQYGNADASL